MATSYFRNRAGLRARNPYLDAEDPVMTPTFSQPAPYAPPGGAVAILTPPSEATRPRATSPYAAPAPDPITLARDQYASEPVTGAKNIILNILKSAGVGALQAIANNPNDPVGAAIGGAATGGAVGGISPRTGRGLQFNTLVRPGMEAQERREQERLRRQQVQEDRARSISMDELKRREMESQIDLQHSQAEENRRPRAVVPRMETGRHRQTGQISYYNPLDPAQNAAYEPAAVSPHQQALRQGPDGNYYDVNNPVQDGILRQLNAKLPRDRFGRFISRSDERANARMGGGGEKDAKAMQAAVEDFNRTKRALEEATARGDGAQANDLRRRLQGLSASIAQNYGDRIETGGGEWPYIKPRGGMQSAPSSFQPSANRSQAKAKLMANGFDDAEAEQELDRLGIR